MIVPRLSDFVCMHGKLNFVIVKTSVKYIDWKLNSSVSYKIHAHKFNTFGYMFVCGWKWIFQYIYEILVSFTLDHYIVGLKINYSYEACVRWGHATNYFRYIICHAFCCDKLLLALISQKEHFVMSSFFSFSVSHFKRLNITRTKQITLIISFEYF